MKLCLPTIIALVLAAGCGSPYPHFEASSVEYSLLGAFGELQAEVNALAQHALISTGDGPDSYDLIQDMNTFTQYLSERNVPKTLLGVCQHAPHTILIIPADVKITIDADESAYIPRKRIKSILAHEIGHAMGLKHTSSGLMDPIMTSECVGREAQCLLSALRGDQKM